MTQGDPLHLTPIETNDGVLNPRESAEATPVASIENSGTVGPPEIFLPETTVLVHPAAEADPIAAQTLSRLLKLEEVVRNLIPAQMRRSKSIEDRSDSLQEALMSQVGGIETHYRSAVSTVELKLMASINALKSRVDDAESGRGSQGSMGQHRDDFD